MKKIIMFAVLAVAMVFAASCAKEDGKKVDEEKVVKATEEPAKAVEAKQPDVKAQEPTAVQTPPEPAKVPEAVQPVEQKPEEKPAETVKAVEPVKRADVNVVEIPADPDKVYKIGYSLYITWLMMAYLSDTGIMDKWADKYGVKIAVDFYPGYADSMTAFNTQDDLVGLTVTNMDSLTGLSLAGTDVEVNIVQDYSNGNDKVIARGDVSDLADIVSHKVIMERKTVSEFCLYRCLEKKAPTVRFADLQLENVAEAEMVTVFTNDPNVLTVTWNPHAMNILQLVSGAHLLCSSAEIPGEILDMLVFKLGAPTAVKKAVVGAWFEGLSQLNAKDPAIRGKVLEYLAAKLGFTVPAVEGQLKTTFMYYTPQDSLAYTMGDQLPKTMDDIRTFCYVNNMFPAEAKSKDEVGIAFPDGSIQGNKDKVKLTFNPAYVQLAADGAL